MNKQCCKDEAISFRDSESWKTLPGANSQRFAGANSKYAWGISHKSIIVIKKKKFLCLSFETPPLDLELRNFIEKNRIPRSIPGRGLKYCFAKFINCWSWKMLEKQRRGRHFEIIYTQFLLNSKLPIKNIRSLKRGFLNMKNLDVYQGFSNIFFHHILKIFLLSFSKLNITIRR